MALNNNIFNTFRKLWEIDETVQWKIDGETHDVISTSIGGLYNVTFYRL